MAKIHHINCGTLHAPPNPRIACHCLLIETPAGLALVDTGIGLEDVRRPQQRIGQELIDLVGFQFDEQKTAARRIEALGFRREDVRHIILTHADPDHAGGLADFPSAQVHISEEEHRALTRGDPPPAFPRYLPIQFDHAPRWQVHGPDAPARDWFGLPARPLDLGPGAEVLLIPLPGHTHGHCGVAVRNDDGAAAGWLLHAGDAYYLRPELDRDDHPVSAIAAARADNDPARRASIEHLRRLLRDHAAEVHIFGYHDPTELPGGID